MRWVLNLEESEREDESLGEGFELEREREEREWGGEVSPRK